jgi:competence protein ComEA
VKHSITSTTLIAAALLLVSSLALAAAETRTATPVEAKSANTAAAKKAKKTYPKLVDINSAGKAELKKLRGIGDAEADRIINGRPYLSKAHLVTRKIIPHGIYEQIKKQIIAVQQPAANKK